MTARSIWRRVLAAIVLIGFAAGSVVFWNEGGFDWGQFTVNLVIACAGLFWLHYRWKTQERRALTPRKVKDIFS